VIQDPWFYAAAIPAILLVGISKGGFGSGAGMFATPLIALTVPIPQAAAILLPILCVMDMAGLWAYRGKYARGLLRVMLAITRAPDEEGTSQLMRAALFGIAAANFVNFLVSAQAYSDPLLTLLTAYLIGALLGTAALNDGKAQADAAPQLVPARA